jgi:hypothetical protein
MSNITAVLASEISSITSTERTTPTDEDRYLFEVLKIVQTALSRYTMLVPVILGVPGNILSVVVANRKHNRNLSPCVYMAAMGVVDTVFLFDILWYYLIYSRGFVDHLLDKQFRGFFTT